LQTREFRREVHICLTCHLSIYGTSALATELSFHLSYPYHSIFFLLQPYPKSKQSPKFTVPSITTTKMGQSQFGKLLGTIKKKPVTAPDGQTDAEAAPGGKPGDKILGKTSILHDLTHLDLRGAETMAQALTTLASGKPMNDKELLLEHGMSMLQTLPANSGLSQKISDDFVAMLYRDLPHPPPTRAGHPAKYRENDGSGNNPWVPSMGKAGSPYSRSVPPSKPQGPNLPDPELVFDLLLKRTGPFREHPSGLNRLFFSFATVVIHECFQTSRTDPWINETSSYADLSTLYGNTEREQERVRTYQNGLIFPDSIASDRIMMMPPGVVAVLLMFSRNHNAIAKNLLSINEHGSYGALEKLDHEQKVW
jgi:hypothetical protein